MTYSCVCSVICQNHCSLDVVTLSLERFLLRVAPSTPRRAILQIRRCSTGVDCRYPTSAHATYTVEFWCSNLCICALCHDLSTKNSHNFSDYCAITCSSLTCSMGALLPKKKASGSDSFCHRLCSAAVGERYQQAQRIYSKDSKESCLSPLFSVIGISH